MKSARLSGFSMIELMIVVVIIGILAAIAYPAYEDHMLKTRRSVCKNHLLEIAAREEKFFSDNARFTDTLTGTAFLNFRTITIDGSCDLDVVLLPTLGYRARSFIRADGPLAKDGRCSPLTIDSLGQKGEPNPGCW